MLIRRSTSTPINPGSCRPAAFTLPIIRKIPLSPMLNQIHIRKRISKCFISYLRISFFHTFQHLAHWKFSRKSDLQPIIINRNLCISMIQVAAVHSSINNQLTNRIQRNLIDILAMDAFKYCTHMNVPQNKLIRLINLFHSNHTKLTFKYL